VRPLTPLRGSPPYENAARLQLVVVEEGARESASRVPSGDAEAMVVLAQASGELPATLALRVADRVAATERSSLHIGRAVILIGNERGAQVFAARSMVAHTLLSHMVLSGAGELVLAAPGVGVDIRQDLLALVEGLVGEHEQSAVPIRLLLREDAPRLARTSGIHRVRTFVEPPFGRSESFREGRFPRDRCEFVVASRRGGR
jgi:hypothetical protein